MKAIEVQKFGGPEVLRTVEVPTPTPNSGQVLVKVEATGVNFADTLMRRGIYPGGPQPPYIPGFEAAGKIVETGPGVECISEGQQVSALIQAGAYAEYVVADARTLMPVLPDWGFKEAAAFPLVFQTAYHLIKTVAKAQPGESMLVHASAGGVGTALVQLSKVFGLKVFATASSDEKLERVKALGADEIINYSQKDFVKEIRGLTSGAGVDIVLDSIGGELIDKNIEILAVFGRLVCYGMASGSLGTVDVGRLFEKSKTVSAFYLNSVMEKPGIMMKGFQNLMDLVASGKVRPVVGQTFKLDEASMAHMLMESRKSYGKIVLEP